MNAVDTLLTAALAGHVKKADIDPMLLWGAAGAGAGGVGSILKSIAQGKNRDEEDGSTAAGRALRTALMGGLVGAGGAGGAKLLGMNTPDPRTLLAAKKQPGVKPSIGIGLLGAGGALGLGALSRTRTGNNAFAAALESVKGAPGQAVAAGAAKAVPGSPRLTKIMDLLAGGTHKSRTAKSMIQELISRNEKNHTGALWSSLDETLSAVPETMKKRDQIGKMFSPKNWQPAAAAGVGLGGAHYSLSND